VEKTKMSNLSDIGFPVKSEQDVNEVIMNILNHLKSMPCPPRGYYFKFEDESGAEIYLQTNPAQEIMGFNPAFTGKSSRKVGLTKLIERDTSELDGAFQAWAGPSGEGVEVTGEYPFVFDVPDFRRHDRIDLPHIVDIQLVAFASNDFELFTDEDEFNAAEEAGQKFAKQSFIPSGLFSVGTDGNMTEIDPPQAHGILTGEIQEFELRTNKFTGENFYWFLVEGYGGDIDVVADTGLIKKEPKVGGIIRGSFWLSGKLSENG
jgi:hypothetical protein